MAAHRGRLHERTPRKEAHDERVEELPVPEVRNELRVRAEGGDGARRLLLRRELRLRSVVRVRRVVRLRVEARGLSRGAEHRGAGFSPAPRSLTR
jgi:hypothetical protein